MRRRCSGRRRIRACPRSSLGLAAFILHRRTVVPAPRLRSRRACKTCREAGFGKSIERDGDGPRLGPEALARGGLDPGHGIERCPPFGARRLALLVADVAIVPVVQAAVEARQLGGERDETGIGSGGIVRPGSRGNDRQRARPGGQVPQHGRPQPLIPRVPFVRIQQVRSPRHQRHGGRVDDRRGC